MRQRLLPLLAGWPAITGRAGDRVVVLVVLRRVGEHGGPGRGERDDAVGRLAALGVEGLQDDGVAGLERGQDRAVVGGRQLAVEVRPGGPLELADLELRRAGDAGDDIGVLGVEEPPLAGRLARHHAVLVHGLADRRGRMHRVAPRPGDRVALRGGGRVDVDEVRGRGRSRGRGLRHDRVGHGRSPTGPRRAGGRAT